MVDKERILKDSFVYSLSTYLATFFSVVTGFVIRRVLGPAMMGTFSILLLIFDYSKHHHIGIFNALERELPYYNGRGDFAKVEEIKDTGFSATVFTSLLIAVGIMLVSLAFPLERNLSIGMRFIAVALLLQSSISFLTVIVKTHHQFTFVSKYIIYLSLLQMLLTIYLGVRFGLFGLLWVIIINGFVSLIYLLGVNIRFKFRLPFSFQETLRLLKVGTPLLMNDVAFLSLMNMDKFSIIKFFGSVGLGYYSIAAMMASYIYMLPNLIYSVLFPRFYESFGRTGDISKLRQFFETPTVIISYLMAGLIAAIISVLPLLIKYILPQYEIGMSAANILLQGMFFMSLLGMPTYLLVALNKQRQMILLNLLGISVAFFFNYLFLGRLKWNIEGAASAMLVSYFIYSSLFIGYAFRHYSRRFYHLVQFLGKIYLLFLWLVIIVFLINRFFLTPGLGFKMDCLQLSARLFIVIAAYFPLLYYLNKKTLVVDRIAALLNLGRKAGD